MWSSCVPSLCWSPVPVRQARLATAAVSSAGSTGLAICVWKPARSERLRSSVRAKAVRAAAGISLSPLDWPSPGE